MGTAHRQSLVSDLNFPSQKEGALGSGFSLCAPPPTHHRTLSFNPRAHLYSSLIMGDTYPWGS